MACSCYFFIGAAEWWKKGAKTNDCRWGIRRSCLYLFGLRLDPSGKILTGILNL
jgi:hypothetical protein